jgi:type IV secretion system protein VirB4
VNPFRLEPTESNITFLYSFVKLLLTNGGAELEPEDDDVIHKAVRDMYLLDVENRRLSNLFLPKKLDRYLSKWVGKGVYAATNNLVQLAPQLSADISKTSAIKIGQSTLLAPEIALT